MFPTSVSFSQLKALAGVTVAWLGLVRSLALVTEMLCSLLRGSGQCWGLTDSFPSPWMLQALEAVNTQLRELYPDSEELFDIVLMTNNHAQVGVRLINSINHYGESEVVLCAGAMAFGQRYCLAAG